MGASSSRRRRTQAPITIASKPPRGPWTHEHPDLFKSYLVESLAWLDRHVRGVPVEFEGGPVRYFVTGACQWRDTSTWPPAGTVDQAWFLHPDGSLSPSPPPDGPPSRYRYDPAEPAPALGGPTAQRRPRVDQAGVEKRPDVLVFTSGELDRPVEVAGPVRATIHLRSSAVSTDVVVRLCDVDRRGRSVNLCDGICRVAPDHPRDGDGVRRVEVERWPTAHRFAPGHRIRVQVTSAATPRFQPNPGTDQPLVQPHRGVPADQEVFHDRHHPSSITLPLQGALGDAPVSLGRMMVGGPGPV